MRDQRSSIVLTVEETGYHVTVCCPDAKWVISCLNCTMMRFDPLLFILLTNQNLKQVVKISGRLRYAEKQSGWVWLSPHVRARNRLNVWNASVAKILSTGCQPFLWVFWPRERSWVRKHSYAEQINSNEIKPYFVMLEVETEPKGEDSSHVWFCSDCEYHRWDNQSTWGQMPSFHQMEKRMHPKFTLIKLQHSQRFFGEILINCFENP